jgi:hypothetical protein
LVRWSEFAAVEPEFARRIHTYFPLNTNATLATLRRDGSPRISGSNVVFAADGDLWIYAWPSSVRLADLRRDPRLAIHSNGFVFDDDLNYSGWPGDAKISGCGVETVIDSDIGIEWDSSNVDLNKTASMYTQYIRDYSLTGFRIDVKEVVRTYQGEGDYFIVDSWHHEKRKLRRREVRGTGVREDACRL